LFFNKLDPNPLKSQNWPLTQVLQTPIFVCNNTPKKNNPDKSAFFLR
jgi:hypothetical protein